MRHRKPLVFLAVFFLGIIAAISAQQTSASISQRGLGVAAKELSRVGTAVVFPELTRYCYIRDVAGTKALELS